MRYCWIALLAFMWAFGSCGPDTNTEKPTTEQTHIDGTLQETAHTEVHIESGRESPPAPGERPAPPDVSTESILDAAAEATPEQHPVERVAPPETKPEAGPEATPERTAPPEAVPETPPEPPSGRLLPPGQPGASDLTMQIHSQRAVHPISPYVYGMNHPEWTNADKDLNLPMGRVGGNRWTAYNWENNASNAGSDYQHQNDSYLGGGNTPGGAVRLHVDAAHKANAAMLITVPIQGYVAADKAPGGDVNQTPNYLSRRFHQVGFKKPSALSVTPDLTDAFVYQDEFVHWVNKTYPYAATDALRKIFYSLDNEPDLWSHTHARIQSQALRYTALLKQSIDAAKAIKSVVPTALTFGPVSYGWNGYVNLQNAPDAGQYGDFLTYYLKEMAKASLAAKQRLLDVLDVHWYPEAQGDGKRITGNETSAGVVTARVQAPRSLWDTSYREQSWIDQVVGQSIRLIPRLQEKIRASYPDTRIAITEYNYGGTQHISGGVAQADVLGVFGQQDIFAACFWPLSGDVSYVRGAFQMFRNFDGANGTFGDTSIEATSSKIADATVYASVDANKPDRMVLVAINKTTSAKRAGIAITHTVRFGKIEVYQLTAASATPKKANGPAFSALNAFVYTMPPMSVSTLVLRP